MRKPDYSTWYTKQQAAERLGVSTKSIELFTKAGKIQQALWKRPSGGPRLAVFAPVDIDHMAAERENAAAPPFVMPATTKTVTPKAARSNGQALARKTPSTTPLNGSTILQVLRTLQKSSEISEKLALTISEAADYSGVSEAYIRRACQAGKLTAIRDGGWKVQRASLVNHIAQW